MYLNKNVTLAVDVIFANWLDFFVCTSWWISFTMLEYIPKGTKGKLISSINKVISIYNASGFKIITALVYQELYCLIHDFPGGNINPTDTSKYVPEIEI